MALLRAALAAAPAAAAARRAAVPHALPVLAAVGGARFFAADKAGEAGKGGGFVRTEAGMQDLYMRALEPKPAPVCVPSTRR